MAWQLQNVTTAVDLSDAVEAPSLVVTQRAYAETSRLSARIRDEASSIVLATEHEILLTDGAQKVFAGLVRVLSKADTGVSTQRVYEIECQDYTTLLSDDYVPSGAGLRTTVESDAARISWLFSTFGTRGVAIGAAVQTIKASMPPQDFSGKTLRQCLTLIASVTGGSFYVDYDKALHYFNSEVNAAPFGLSDDPNYSTTFPYDDFKERTDSVDFINEVHVIGAPGISVTRYLGGSPPAAGTRRATIIEDATIETTAQANDRGDSLLGSYGVTKKPSTLTTTQPGLRAGQYVQVTHAGWSISAVSYRIAGMSARPETKDRIRYEVDFGSGSVDLASLLSGTVGQLADAAAVAAEAQGGIIGIADLSVGGANLVPNSSFEDGTSWIVGAQWTIGFTPSGGQLPFHGAKTARAALSAQTAGDLVTPKITVDRGDEYAVSFWRYVRSRSSGTFRAFVKEYDASNVLLATNTVDFAAADTDWERTIIRFAPAAALNPTKIAWQASTAKIEIGFNSAGASATLTVDVDGVQLERGEAPTAYAPAPQEIVAGSIGTTQIADDAITTPKLIASAVTAAKIAAGTITADKIAAGTITTDKLAAGTITLYDEFGSSLLTPGGFSGAWADFVATGLYNGALRVGVAGTIGLGRTSALPYWTVTNDAGTDAVLTFLNPGVRFSWASVSGVKKIASDNVPVLPGQSYRVGVAYAVTHAAGDIVFTIVANFYNALGTFLSAESLGVLHHTATQSFTTWGKTVTAPSGAYFMALTLKAAQTVHNASNRLDFWNIKAQQVEIGHGSTAPANPSTDDLWFRTDSDMWFVFDGTRWICTCPHELSFIMDVTTTLPLSATSLNRWILTLPVARGLDVLIEAVDAMFLVDTGGSALSGSHHWQGTLVSRPNGIAIATLDINSGASNSWRSVGAAPGVVLDLPGEVGLALSWTKTGTPGNLFQQVSATFRYISA